MTQRRTPLLMFALAGALLAVTTTGCKKSAKELEQQWGETMAAAAGYGTRYPEFKAVMDKRVAAASAAYKTARAAKGDDKLQQMKSAISLLRSAYGPLSTYEARVARVRRLKRDRYVHRNPSAMVRPALSFANVKLAAAAHELHGPGPAATLAEMQVRAQHANAMLSDALRPLRRLERRGHPKKTVVIRRKRRRKRR